MNKLYALIVVTILNFTPFAIAQTEVTPETVAQTEATPEAVAQTELTPEDIAHTQQEAEEAAAAAAAAGCGVCGGSVVFMVVAAVLVFVLNIALLIWVARDAKNRSMDSSVLWMLLVMFTGPIGFIIYIFSRPQGQLSQCSSCNSKRLSASAKCPHCQNP
jgi:hypothetical protein